MNTSDARAVEQAKQKILLRCPTHRFDNEEWFDTAWQYANLVEEVKLLRSLHLLEHHHKKHHLVRLL